MKKSVFLKYGIAVAIGAALAAVYLLLRDFSGSEPAERYRMLCDAFTIPGTLLILSAALVALANQGSFTGIGYSAKNFFNLLIPGAGLRKHETYGDYYERHKKKVTGYGFLLHVGAVFMAVALVFFVLFYRVFEA